MGDEVEADNHHAGFRPFDLNVTVRRAIYVLNDRRKDLAIAALFLVVGPTIFIMLLEAAAVSQDLIRRFGSWLAILILLSVVVYLVTYVLFSAVVLLIVVPEFWGERTSLKDAWRTAVLRIWPLIGMTILLALAIGVGFAFFIIPGLFLLCCWYVCYPVMVGEKRGVFDSLERSWNLTQGYRGFILVIVVVPMIILSVASYVVDRSVFPALSVPLNMLLEALWLSISSALVGSVYYELLRVKRQYDGAKDEVSAVD